MIIWYTTVGFGGTPTPIGPWKDPQEVADVLNRWLRRKGHKAGQLVNAHSTRVYGYTTRAAARDGYISDSPGRSATSAWRASTISSLLSERRTARRR